MISLDSESAKPVVACLNALKEELKTAKEQGIANYGEGILIFMPLHSPSRQRDLR
jgi:hypothetical protein